MSRELGWKVQEKPLGSARGKRAEVEVVERAAKMAVRVEVVNCILRLVTVISWEIRIVI